MNFHPGNFARWVGAVAFSIKSRLNLSTCVICRWRGTSKAASSEPVTLDEVQYPVSYVDRVIHLPSGEAIIWPYHNVCPGPGPYELTIDCNSYRSPGWITQLPKNFGNSRTLVNLLPALSEEWLANPEFRKSPRRKIREIVKRYETLGICFPRNYASRTAKTLQRRSNDLRYNWTILFFYIAINKKLLERSNTEDAMAELVRLSAANVPRAGLMLSLCCLSLFLKRHQGLKLTGDRKTAYSYIQRFFDYQPGSKGEPDHLTESYLRNRALDLAIYYFLPVTLSKLTPPMFEPVIVTKDVPLKQLIVRVLPFLYDPRYAPAIPTSLAAHEFGEEAGPKFLEWRARLNRAFEAPGSTSEKRKRLSNLAQYAKSLCTSPEEVAAIETIWLEWASPYLKSVAVERSRKNMRNPPISSKFCRKIFRSWQRFSL